MYRLQPAQIKAARAMLDWSQERMAEEAGVAVSTIRNIETGCVPSVRVAENIKRAVEKAGLEFTTAEGVQRRRDFDVFMGEKSTECFLEDLKTTIQLRGGDVVSMMESSEMLADTCGAVGPNAMDRLLQIGKIAPVKCLLPQTSEFAMRIPQFEFRAITSFSIMPPPFYIYGNKYAHVLLEENGNYRYLVFTSTRMASSHRTQFHVFWEKGRPLTARTNA